MAMNYRPTPQRPVKRAVEEDKPTLMDYFKAIFLHVPDDVEPITIIGRGLVYTLIFFWGLTFIFHSVDSNYVALSFLHLPNLAFHEAGHIIFSPFGRFLTVLGGSLCQVLMPTIILGAFLLTNRDAFGASIALWWVGQNFMDMAPYIADARDLKLPLLGGVTGRDVADYHDWEYLLETTGLIRQDKLLGQASHFFGAALMILAFVWGGYMLHRQYTVWRESKVD